jgi:hypothetical protein
VDDFSAMISRVLVSDSINDDNGKELTLGVVSREKARLKPRMTLRKDDFMERHLIKVDII